MWTCVPRSEHFMQHVEHNMVVSVHYVNYPDAACHAYDSA